MTVTRFAPAKINLCLHVGRPNADGRHPLESLVVFAGDVGDSLSARPADALTLNITGPFAGDLPVSDDNLVLRAARKLADVAKTTPRATLTLEKNLPIASGIGGGSADAAAALRALNDLWGLGLSLEDLEAIAVELGADVPACVRSRTVRMTGTGEIIEPAMCPPLHAVLVNPRTPAPTGAVYRAFDDAGLGFPSPSPAALPQAASETFRWLAAQANDLEPAACVVAPVIAEVLKALRRQAPEALVRMSGSGATCFALLADADESVQLAAAMQTAHAAWWTRATVLG
jgi:4-diphosphocytidyl-2-C-methyl-D-erythritol kinase